jgi:hypothetical protein
MLVVPIDFQRRGRVGVPLDPQTLGAMNRRLKQSPHGFAGEPGRCPCWRRLERAPRRPASQDRHSGVSGPPSSGSPTPSSLVKLPRAARRLVV